MASILSLDIAARTDIGRTRPTNEDNVVSVIPQDAQIMTKKGALFIAADGLGGKTKGDVASEMAVTTIRDAYYQDESDDILSSLQQAVEKANQIIYQQNEKLFKDKDELEKKAMGTTCVAAALKESTVYVANVGDSLAYIVHVFLMLAEVYKLRCASSSVKNRKVYKYERRETPSENNRCLRWDRPPSHNGFISPPGSARDSSD